MEIDESTTLKELQEYVKHYSEKRGFTKDPSVKFFKFIEEVGELSKAIGAIKGAKSDASRVTRDVEEEFADVMFLLFGMAYTLNINIAEVLSKKDVRNQKRKWK